MNILIAGGTGFIGTALTNKLIEQRHYVYIVSRNPHKYSNRGHITYVDYDVSTNQLPKIDAVINLAGESLFGRWTDQKKQRILASRMESTEQIINLIERLEQKPAVFINASAVGFYGMDNETIFTEQTNVAGSDFLAKITDAWERTAKRAETLGVRVVFARFGIILAKQDGALSLMRIPFQSFIGGKIGEGEQWMSWIHIDDCVNMLLFAIHNGAISGPLNITAPHPVRNKQFTTILGKTLKRPTMFTVPERIARVALGEMSSLVTKGQFVYPDKAFQNHFDFTFPHLQDALIDIFKKSE